MYIYKLYHLGCPYGDRASICSDDLCGNQGNRFVCCWTCRADDTTMAHTASSHTSGTDRLLTDDTISVTVSTPITSEYFVSRGEKQSYLHVHVAMMYISCLAGVSLTV